MIRMHVTTAFSFTFCAFVMLHTAVEAQCPQTIQLRSGNGAVGGTDSLVSMLTGPVDSPFSTAFTPADFTAAQNGPHAYIIPPYAGAWIGSLPSDPSAHWIGTVPNNSGGGSALYAVPFVIANAPASAVTIDLYYAVDNTLGQPPNEGLYLNGVAIPNTYNSNSGAFSLVNHLVVSTAGSLLLPGANTLYIVANDQGGPAGLIFSVTITFDACSPPAFQPPTPCGQTLTTTTNAPVTFTISGLAATGAVTLTASGAPLDATFSPALPLSGNVVQSAFAWTPASDATNQTLTFTLTDQTGLQTQCTVNINVVPQSDLAMIASSWSINPSAALIGQPSAIAVAATNLGNLSSGARVDFYENNPVGGGTLIGSDTETVAFGVPKAFTTTWIPTKAGLTPLFAVVTNLSFVDAATTNNQAQVNVWVNAPVELLIVHPCAVTGWTAASFDTAFTVENAGSTAATITGLFSASGWVAFPNAPLGRTLAPGQTLQVGATVAVPANTAGGVGVPTDYPSDTTVLTVSGAFYVGVLDARVFAVPPLATTVTVVDATNNAPLAGATVAVDDVQATFTTDGAGQAVIPLPEGQRGFYGYKPGFIAGQTIVNVTAMAPNVVVALQPGAALAVQTIVSQPLTAQDIIDRGVNVMDPVNNVVVDFVVSLQIGTPLVLPNVEIPASPPLGSVVTFGGPYLGGAAGGGGGVITGTFTYPAPNVRQETWIIIPGSVWALKEFREATIVVRNNATATPASAIRFENVSATLGLPAGLSLPDLNGAPQPATQSLPTVNAGEQAQAKWAIRGDVSGAYQLVGSAVGDLYLGVPGTFATTVTATATSEPFAVELPQLRLAFETPTAVTAGQPFDFGVDVTNDGQATARSVRVSLKVDRLINCSVDPNQPGPAPTPPPLPTICSGCNCSPCFAAAPLPSDVYYDAFNQVTRLEVEVGDLPPGQTAGAHFRLLSHVTGVVLQVQTQIWNNTTTSPFATAAQRYPGTPATDPHGGCLMLTGINVPLSGADAAFLKTVPNVPQVQTLAVRVDTFNPALYGQAFLLAIDLFTPGPGYDLPPPTLSAYPDIFLSVNALILVDGFALNWTLAPGGISFVFGLPPGLGGFHVMMQALTATPIGSYCATDAHEFVFE